MITRPMLAAAVKTRDDLDGLDWAQGLLASPKIDGLRCLIHPEHGPVTRKFKSLPNNFVREKLHKLALQGFDGELVAVDEDGMDLTFNETQSALMSHGGEPRFKYYVFDDFQEPDMDYEVRLQRARERIIHSGEFRVRWLKHNHMASSDEVVNYFDLCLSKGFEGIMLRDRFHGYKSGRSTLRQQGLLKFKPLADAEGTIVGFEELLHNENPQEEDAFGLAERSSHKDNKVRGNTLGALILSTGWGWLKVGTGFDQATRQEIWDNQSEYLDKVVTFTYQQQGMKDKPRFPVYKGVRHD